MAYKSYTSNKCEDYKVNALKFYVSKNMLKQLNKDSEIFTIKLGWSFVGLKKRLSALRTCPTSTAWAEEVATKLKAIYH